MRAIRTTTGSTGSPERRHSRPTDSALDVEVTYAACSAGSLNDSMNSSATAAWASVLSPEPRCATPDQEVRLGKPGLRNVWFRPPLLALSSVPGGRSDQQVARPTYRYVKTDLGR